jgi:hypothetical protein
MREFLEFAGMKNPDVFFRFHAEFKRSRYLNTYINIDQITYALNVFVCGLEQSLYPAA